MYSNADKVLRVWLHIPLRSLPNLQENTLQAQGVIPSSNYYGKILLRYLSAYRLECAGVWLNAEGLWGIFSFCKSGEQQKIVS